MDSVRKASISAARNTNGKQNTASDELEKDLEALSEHHRKVVELATENEIARRRAVVFRGVKEDGKVSLSTNMKNDTFMGVVLGEAMGGGSPDWVNHLISQIANVGVQGSDLDSKARSLGAGISFVQSMGPANSTEAALLGQMFAVHNLAMKAALRAEAAELVDHAKLFLGQSNKLARTFAVQVEALAKLRNGGKQTVEVKYVDARNSQNIIADTVTTGGGGALGKLTQPVAQALAHQPGSPCPPMWSAVEKDGMSVQSACDQGQA